MNYFIERDGQRFGPYTLADLQRYTASGNIALTDLCTSEGMAEPVPVSQIIGTIAVPATGYTPAPLVSVGSQYPSPPNLHWALVLLFTLLTCGLFFFLWQIIQAAWLRKIVPESKALFWYLGSILVLICAWAIGFTATVNHTGESPVSSLLNLAYTALQIVGYFNFKSGMEQHYNSEEPMGLQLSGVMTFFFGPFYFQYHMNEINRRKQADRLYEAGR